MLGDPLGLHRVLEGSAPEVGARGDAAPAAATSGSLPLPQRAYRVDGDPAKVFETEIVVDVATLNIDAASFRQMEEAGDVAELVAKTVRERGKQHNPVTGSGGMLLGTVTRVGSAVTGRGFAVGDRVATLASLSLTPLHLERILRVHPASCQVDVEGKAFIFASAPMGKLPTDLPERLALAALDVAGAAPQVGRLVAPGDAVVVLGGGGKSGILSAVEARRRAGAAAKIIAVESYAPFADDLRALGICDHVLGVDARDAIAVRDAVRAILPDGADLTLSCVNVPGCEMGAILATRDRGRVYFFAMSTSFTACALGAEGVGADVDLFIGNGYAHGHADHTLALLRENDAVRELFRRRYAG